MRLLTGTAFWEIVQSPVALTSLWSGQIHTASLNLKPTSGFAILVPQIFET